MELRSGLRPSVTLNETPGPSLKAILARVPLQDAGHVDWCAKGDARHVAARLPGGAVLHNMYIPAGGD